MTQPATLRTYDLNKTEDRAALSLYETERAARITAGQQLYASIKRNSKYYGQTDPGALFPVEVLAAGSGGDYLVQGGPGGQYRLRDVHLYVADTAGRTTCLTARPKA